MTEPEFDADGDITEATHAYIREFRGSAREWLEFCRSCWSRNYGNFLIWSELGELKARLSTCGWSSNELVVIAMKENVVMWAMTWESSHRGGHYQFSIKDKVA